MSTTNPERKSASPFVPILLIAVTLLILVAFQATQLYREGTGLAQMRDKQAQPFAEAQRLRSQLDGVAADTARLAEQGNTNARAVIAKLAEHGITINPDAGTVPKP